MMCSHFLHVYYAYRVGVYVLADGQDLVTLSASATMIGNVGPGFGAVGPTNFGGMSSLTKLF